MNHQQVLRSPFGPESLNNVTNGALLTGTAAENVGDTKGCWENRCKFTTCAPF